MKKHSRKWASASRTGLSAVLLAGALLSCSKESAGPIADQGRTEVTDPILQRRITERATRLPGIGFYNKAMDKVIVFRYDNGGKSFSFTDPPGDGINFASSNGGRWTWSESSGLVIVTEPSAGLGAGGGTVVAGSTVLDIGLALCFSFDEEAIGADMFNTGVSDVAGVVGIAGDFDALINGTFTEDDDLFEYFHGFAYYLVYTQQLANRSYDVLNWIEDLDQSTSDLEDFGFAFVVGFQNGGNVYISRNGGLTVSGGSIGFNGTYYGIEGAGYFDEEDDGSSSFVEVPGFGAMGC